MSEPLVIVGKGPRRDWSTSCMTGLLSAAKEVREHGTFGYIDASLATPDMNAFPARIGDVVPCDAAGC